MSFGHGGPSGGPAGQPPHGNTPPHEEGDESARHPDPRSTPRDGDDRAPWPEQVGRGNGPGQDGHGAGPGNGTGDQDAGPERVGRGAGPGQSGHSPGTGQDSQDAEQYGHGTPQPRQNAGQYGHSTPQPRQDPRAAASRPGPYAAAPQPNPYAAAAQPGPYGSPPQPHPVQPDPHHHSSAPPAAAPPGPHRGSPQPWAQPAPPVGPLPPNPDQPNPYLDRPTNTAPPGQPVRQPVGDMPPVQLVQPSPATAPSPSPIPAQGPAPTPTPTPIPAQGPAPAPGHFPLPPVPPSSADPLASEGRSGTNGSTGPLGSTGPHGSVGPTGSTGPTGPTPDWSALADAAATRSRRKRLLYVGGGVLATVAVGALVATAVVSSGSPSDGKNTALPSAESLPAEGDAPSPSFSPVAPPPPPDPKEFISHVQKDKAPLSAATLFPGETLTLEGRAYTKGATHETNECAATTQGALGGILTRNGCDQVIRATFIKNNTAVTVGVAVFETEAQALKAKEQVKDGIASLAGSGVPTFCRNGTICRKTANSYGRYAYFTVGGFTDNKTDVTTADKAVYALGDDAAKYTFLRIHERGRAQASAAAASGTVNG